MKRYLSKTAHEVREYDLLPVSERAKQAEMWAKDQKASDSPSSFELVSRVTEHAVFIEAMSTKMRGVMSIFGIGILFCIGVMGEGISLSTSMLSQSLRQGALGYLLIDLGLTLISVLISIGMFVASVRIFRIDIFGPKDTPLVFNRKTRKVYKFAQEVPMFPSSYNLQEFLQSLKVLPKYWIESLKPWPMVLVEYDWDCMGAEYQQHTSLQGNVVKTLHHFNLHVKESPTSDKVIGVVTPMSPMFVGSRESAASLWEFIRRFMEEGGPVLYPGDKPAPTKPKHLWQSAQMIAPYYWVALLAYSAWTTKYLLEHGFVFGAPTAKTVAAVVVGFASYFFLFTIFFNWLAHTFGFDVELPEEMLADAGPPLDLKQLAAEMSKVAQ